MKYNIYNQKTLHAPRSTLHAPRFTLHAKGFTLHEKGITIYLAMLVMSSALATALFVATVQVREFKISKEVGDSLRAVYVADSAVEYTLLQTRKIAPSFTDFNSTTLIQETATHYKFPETICAAGLFGSAGALHKKCSVDVYPATVKGTVAGCSAGSTAPDCTRLVGKGSFDAVNRAIEIVYENL